MKTICRAYNNKKRPYIYDYWYTYTKHQRNYMANNRFVNIQENYLQKLKIKKLKRT